MANISGIFTLGQPSKGSFMTGLGERLCSERTRLGLSQQKLAEMVGVDRRAIGRYEKDINVPGGAILAAFAKLGADVHYILTGKRESNVQSLSHLKEEKELQDAKLEVVNLFESFVMDMDMRREMALPLFTAQYSCGDIKRVPGIDKVTDSEVYQWLKIEHEPSEDYKSDIAATDEAFASIPLYNVEASAGHGSLVEDEQVERMLIFRKDWIRNELHVNPNDLYLVSVQGDSMYPTISPNDVILVHDDKDGAIVPCDGIYLLRLDDSLLVKRLQRKPNNRVVVMSDNPSYAPYEVDVDDFTDADFCIIGRVVWSGRKM